MPQNSFRSFIRKLNSRPSGGELILKNRRQGYRILVHSPQIASQLRPFYDRTSLCQFRAKLLPCLRIPILPSGTVRAAERCTGKNADPTHYDAAWVRDSLWVYLSMRSDDPESANQVLVTLLDSISTPKQLSRFKKIIRTPEIMRTVRGPMSAVHIRFDANSPSFEDVQIDGKPQYWNHQQNDALGLLFDLTLDALTSKHLSFSSLRERHWSALALLPMYFFRIRFFEMEEAGSWEEIERCNTSSVALVVSGLEKLERILFRSRLSHDRAIAEMVQVSARQFGVNLKHSQLEALIELGYARIFAQLEAGGESPFYPFADPRYRGGDAALLNLIYPASLSRLQASHWARILNLIEPLLGSIGIKRYSGDSYQSANSWWRKEQWLASPPLRKGASKMTRAARDFVRRAQEFIPGTEAQWFLDSWYSKVMGRLYSKTKESYFRDRQTQFLNRSLAQMTGSWDGEPPLAADGSTLGSLLLPESYNTILSGDLQYFIPSPIAPLNWARASLLLAFDEFLC